MRFLAWLWRLIWRKPRPAEEKQETGFVLSFEHEGLVYRLLASDFYHSGTRQERAAEVRNQPYQPTCQFGRIIGPSQHIHLFFTLYGDVTCPRDLRVEREGCYPCLLKGLVLSAIELSVAAGDMTFMEGVHGICADVSDELA